MNSRTATLAPPSNPNERETICESVVEAVADAKGLSPLDLEPLAAVIDPDALESLVASMDSLPGETPGAIEFAFNGVAVTVGEAGDVSVAPLES